MKHVFQNFINSLSEGLGVVLIRSALWLALVAGMLSLFYFTQYRGLSRGDAMEQCQLARNLARSGRFETHVIRPLDTWILRRKDPLADISDAMPDIRTPPAYAWVLSQAMPDIPSVATSALIRRHVLRTERIVIPVLGAVLTIATAFILLLLGGRFFSARVGRVAFVVYAVSAPVLEGAFAGTALPLATFLVTTLIALCTLAAPCSEAKPTRVASWLAIALAGLVGVAAILSHYAMALLLLPAALLLGASCGRLRWVATAIVLLLSFGLSLPWFLRNAGLTGNMLGASPYAVLYETLLYPGQSVDRTFTPLIHSSYLVPAVRMKMMAGLVEVLNHGLTLLGAGLVGCCFWASLFYRFDEDRANTLKWSTMLGLVLLAFVSAFDSRALVYLNVLLPIVILVGVAFVAALMERLLFVEDSVRELLLWSLAGLAALPTLLQCLGVSPEPRYPPYHPPTAEYVAGVMEADECIVTDIPWATAWYGDRRSVLLPSTVTDLERLVPLQVKVGGLYLTQGLSDQPYMSGLAADYARDQSWLPLLNRQVPADLPYVHGLLLPAGVRDQLFLTDRVRWETLEELPAGEPPAGEAPAGHVE